MTEISVRKAGYYIRPFCIWAVAVILLAVMGMYLSAGLPWGIDDGVKRLTARGLAEANGSSLLVNPPEPSDIGSHFFPIPPPYMEDTGEGFRSIFPASWQALGGLCYAVFGTPGFYLASAAAFVSLLWLISRLTNRANGRYGRLWILIIVGTALLFYGLTFWEHALALLLLIPLFTLSISDSSTTRSWFWAGASFGMSVGLRPETILLWPLLWLAYGVKRKTQVSRLFLLTGGAIVSILGVLLLEKSLTGRWMASQVPVNFELIFYGTHFLYRFNSLFELFLSSPLPLYLYGNGLLMLLLLSLVRRNAFILALGLPVLSIATMVWAFITKGNAFSITAHSQGLFFAFPWIGISLMSIPKPKWHKDPLFILGWGYLLLAFLLGPDKAGMHWGPRFLFPALLPLALRSVQILSYLPKKLSRPLWLVSLAAALIYASGALLAIAERGHNGREIVEVIQASDCRILILERWHEGADLEPVWAACSPYWVQGEGSMEELLLQLKRCDLSGGIGWLTGEENPESSTFPLEIISRHSFPNTAGWRGDFLNVSLVPGEDRWGELYWHAGRRRAENGLWEDARAFFQRAVNALPFNADIRYDLAICLGRMGLETQAIEALRETLRIDPQHEEARTLMELLGRP